MSPTGPGPSPETPEIRPAIPLGFQEPVTLLLVTGRSDWGLAPRQIFDILRVVKPLGFRVAVAAPQEPPFGMEFRKHADHYIPIARKRFSLRDLMRLRRAVVALKVSAIHSHGQIGGLYSRFLGLLTGASVVHSFHGRAKPASLEGYFYRLLEMFFSSMPFCAVLGSVDEADGMRLAGLIQKTTDTAVLEKAVNLKLYGKRKAMPMAGATTRIGAMLRSSAAPGAGPFLKAAKDGASLGQWSVAGVSRESLRGQDISSQIEFVGPQPDPIAWLQSLDVYISLGRSDSATAEGVLEALAAGCLCILSETAANKALAAAQAALLVKTDSKDELFGVLQELKKDPQLRQSLVQNARYYLERFHNDEKFKVTLLDVYRTAVKRYARSIAQAR